MQTCPACGQANPEGFRLCGMCGAPLAAAAPAAREERKVVTILFTDLVGSTAKAEALDPEDVRKILSPYYARLRAEIERFGGTVEKFIGDAVMAVFGAPVAHEDDAERAVRAALAIRDAVGEELQIRTAVHTGEALVALGARHTEGEGMVSGDVVNTAARLQGAAPVNGILAGDATYRATRHVIEYRGAPPVEAKGKSAPVPVWEVVGARSRLGSDIEERLRAPLVGRDRERALLADTLARARQEQSVQLLTLVGVPGIGKSRLVAELFQIVDDDEEIISWRQGRSLPYGESASFWALGEIVKSHAGILETDDADAAAAKVAAMLEQLVEDEQERRWLELHVRPLVGLEVDDRGVREEAFAAWRRLLEAAAEARPLVLVFEDLHWADDGLLDFVDHLAEWATDVPLLLVGTARPELLDRRPGWGGGKRNAYTVSLGALSDVETAQLLHNLLDRAVLAADLQQAVLERAEGNPLYAAEYVRMLEEHDGGDLPLPDTVQGVIAARIDGLPAAEKSLLQRAAVIGKVFWPGAIDGDESLLHALLRKEFVRRDRRSSVSGEQQYAFLHALVRDVAYAQIPRPERVRLHRAAADWLLARSSDTEMLAHHYREALALAAAAGIDAADLREPAKRAFAEAAARANALNAWPVAVELAQEALALMDEDDPLRPRVQLTLIDARSQLSDWDYDLALRTRDAFLAAGDVSGAAESDMFLSMAAFYLGLGPATREHAAHAVDLLEPLPPSRLYAEAIARHARVTGLAGDRVAAIELAERALALAEQFGDDRIAAHALNTRGMARVYLTGSDEGLADLREAIDRAERASALDQRSKALNNLTNLCWNLGRLAEADATWQLNWDEAQRAGWTTNLHWLEAEQVIASAYAGRLRKIEEYATRVLERGNAGYQQAAPQLFLGMVRVFAGQTAEAVDLVDSCVAEILRIRDSQMLGGLGDCAWVYALAGRHDKARTALGHVEGQTVFDGGSLVPFVFYELGELDRLLALTASLTWAPAWLDPAVALAQGRHAQAAELYEAIGARVHAALAALAAAENGDPTHLERARAYFAAEGATAMVRRCESVLPASA
jgi:class 3 adenylate cyclase